MLYDNPHINWVGFHPLYYPKQPGAFFPCSAGLRHMISPSFNKGDEETSKKKPKKCAAEYRALDIVNHLGRLEFSRQQ